ncbi:MAG: hypothetical protein RBT49_07475 [Bacteroidales bacterium]|nr:hypothetical protein [Bacteroidales bacterium]
MKNKYFRALEILWLISSLLCIVTGIHQTINESLNKSFVFFILAILSFLMFLFRRNLRLKKSDEKTH